MKFNYLMTGASAMLLLLGLSFIVNARWILSFYGIKQTASAEPQLIFRTGPDPLFVGIAFMRVFGALLIGLGVLTWRLRHVEDIGLQSSIASGFFALNSLVFLAVFFQHVAVRPILPELRGSSARLLTIVFFLMSAVFGYFRFVKLDGW